MFDRMRTECENGMEEKEKHHNEERTTTKLKCSGSPAALIALPTIYFRRSDRLSARDRADLEAYAEVLRPYYGIPEGQPVFPEQEAEPRHTNDEPIIGAPPKVTKTKPRATGINRDGHPWRNTL